MSSLGQGIKECRAETKKIKECPTKTTQLTSLVNGHLKVRTFGWLRDSVWIMKQDASLSVEKVNLSTSTQQWISQHFQFRLKLRLSRRSRSRRPDSKLIDLSIWISNLCLSRGLCVHLHLC